MAYVITEPCGAEKDRACVPACPIDVIHEGPKMLYIEPDTCIDCGACEPVCPVNAIFHEDEVPEKWKGYIAENRAFYDAGEPCTCHPEGR